MHVTQEICQSCGMTTEVIAHRFGDSVPLCGGCKRPLRPAPTASPVGAMAGGSLQLRMVPGRGLGVFSMQPVAKDTLVERCPVFVLDRITESIRNTKLLPYAESQYNIALGHILFPWINDTERAIVLGYAMLYNHEPTDRSNIRYSPYVDPDNSRRFVDFYAKRDIEAGEELTQTYATNNRLWFTYKPPVGVEADG
jgi:hypothetical protein